MATMPPSRRSMTTTEPATPLPVPIVPFSGAMSADSSRSATY